MLCSLPQGRVGKSVLSAYLIDHNDALLVTSADEEHLINVVYNDMATNNGRSRAMYIIDLPRRAKAEAPYMVLEKIMNGRLVNTKYAGCTVTLDPVIIVVMANEPPNMVDTWSKDRFFTTDGVSTVVDLSNQEQECDRLLAQPQHRQRSHALQQAMLAFYKDVVQIPDADLETINNGMPAPSVDATETPDSDTVDSPPVDSGSFSEDDAGEQQDDDILESPFGFNSRH